MDQALSGIRVIDLTHYVAGPYCTKLMATSGAEVVKVERPGTGDPSRRAGPFPCDAPDPEKSGLFLYLNTSKLGVTINLKSATGRRILLELARDADMLAESFAPGTLDRLGLGYDELERVNPKLVLLSISNFGQSGPYRDYKASELVLQALAGLAYLTGDGDREPLKYALNQVQYVAGANAAAMSLVALFHALGTGEGQQVDVSVQESVAGFYWTIVAQYAYTGLIAGRGPNDMFPCKDGWVMPHRGVTSPWDIFVALMDAPELLEERFIDPTDRLRQNDAVNEIIKPKLLQWGKRELVEAGQAAGMPFGFLQEVPEVMACPQMAARGFFQEIEHPRAGALIYPGRPFKMSESPAAYRPAPLLGQHNEEVLCGRLGYSRGDLARLRAMGAI